MHGITTNASILSTVSFDINHIAGTTMHTTTLIPIAAEQMHGITANASILRTVAFDINHIAGTTMNDVALQKAINIVVSHYTGHVTWDTTTG